MLGLGAVRQVGTLELLSLSRNIHQVVIYPLLGHHHFQLVGPFELLLKRGPSVRVRYQTGLDPK